jgi:hypothetical protein
MSDPTAEQIALVDELIERHVDGEEYENWLLNHFRQIALAAIIETSERAAKLADAYSTARHIATALRNQEHLK